MSCQLTGPSASLPIKQKAKCLGQLGGGLEEAVEGGGSVVRRMMPGRGGLEDAARGGWEDDLDLAASGVVDRVVNRVVDRSRMAFSKNSLLDTTPQLAANNAISLRRAEAAGPARPNVSLLSGTNRHAPMPVRLYLSRLSKSFPLAVAPVSRAAALTAEAANGCVTHMSATIGRPGSSASRSPRSGSRREREGSCCAAAWPRAAHGRAGAEGLGGPEGPAGMDGSVVAVAVPAVAPGVGAASAAVVATSVAAAAPASAGEEPVSKNGDAGRVGRGAVVVGHHGGKRLAVGGTVRGAVGGVAAEGAAEGEALVPYGVEGTVKAGLLGSSEVVRVTHVVLPSQGCGLVGLEGSTGRLAARSRCGSCFTCGSRLEKIPARAKTLRHASTILL